MPRGTGRRSKGQVVLDDVAGQIARGMLRPGDRLPSTADLCRRYGVSSLVVRNAVARLAARELVRGVPGVGVFVADRKGGPGGPA